MYSVCFNYIIYVLILYCMFQLYGVGYNYIVLVVYDEVYKLVIFSGWQTTDLSAANVTSKPTTTTASPGKLLL